MQPELTSFLRKFDELHRSLKLRHRQNVQQTATKTIFRRCGCPHRMRQSRWRQRNLLLGVCGWKCERIPLWRWWRGNIDSLLMMSMGRTTLVVFFMISAWSWHDRNKWWFFGTNYSVNIGIRTVLKDRRWHSNMLFRKSWLTSSIHYFIGLNELHSWLVEHIL